MLKQIIIVCGALIASSQAISLPKIFGNGMVLQGEPTSAHIWGGLDGIADGDVHVDVTCDSGATQSHVANKADDAWSAILDPIPNGVICDITVRQADQADLTITDVLFADVWICSGQSNMEWPMSAILNAEEEIADITTYTNIRTYRVAHATSANPEAEFIIPNWPDFWTKASQTDYIKEFSAVCLLFAKELTKLTGGTRSFGLIETNWGGTRIEPWSTPEGLATCEIEHLEDPQHPSNSNSYLYNAMINPLIKFSIKGAIWYQGEANSFHNQNKYQCSFPQMIADWRTKWSTNSPTASDFPFGFVQLAAWRADYAGVEFPVVRWHQTADFGYVPNDKLEKVFMAVSIDTYDAESGIHPRNKQLVSQRLALAGSNIAYGQFQNPLNGPFPNYFSSQILLDSILEIVEYDQDFEFSVKEGKTGFYYCCEHDPNDCDNVANAWKEVPEGQVLFTEPNSLFVTLDICTTSLAYLWNESPFLETEGLPIYSIKDSRLPGAPWKVNIEH